jgi:hypothetical protein
MICHYQPDNHPILQLHEQSKIQGTHADFRREKTSCVQETAHGADKALPLDVGQSEKYRMSARAVTGEDAIENSQHYAAIKLSKRSASIKSVGKNQTSRAQRGRRTHPRKQYPGVVPSPVLHENSSRIETSEDKDACYRGREDGSKHDLRNS